MSTATKTRTSLSRPWLFALASLGSALEFYDFVVFVFLTGPISSLFFPTSVPTWSRLLQTYAIFSVGYFARPLGGIVMAHLGDTRGRKSTFLLSVMLMAIPTLLISLLPTYKTVGVAAPIMLMGLRILQGIAIGGEAPAGWIYIGEHASDRGRGFAIGLLTSGLSVGILIGSLVVTLLNRSFTPAQIELGIWRIPFALGGVFGLTAAFLRRWLSETPVFAEWRTHTAAETKLPIWTVLTTYRGAFVRALLLTWMLTAAIVVLLLMSPALLHALFKLPVRITQPANLLATAALCVSTAAFGAAYDRFGTKRVCLIALPLFVAVTYALYYSAGHNPQYVVGLYALAGLLAGSIVVAPIEMFALFPTAVRLTGFAASYNIAYAICGGLAPIVVSSFSRYDTMAAPHYIAAANLMGLIAVVTIAKRNVTSLPPSEA